MQMSCNGCRVLRKGCSDKCSMRPCLEWIKNPDSQGHATLFLAKFYGRTGLINLINAGPHHLRPAIFRSLLYEACGRVVDPVQGSAGLLWSGSWQLCQNAVDAVLCGAPIIQTAATDSYNGPPDFGINGVAAHDLLLRAKTCRFKRSAKIRQSRALHTKRSLSTGNLQSEVAMAEKKEEVELDLMLGLEPFKGCGGAKKPNKLANGDDSGLCRMELGLHYPALSSM